MYDQHQWPILKNAPLLLVFKLFDSFLKNPKCGLWMVMNHLPIHSLQTLHLPHTPLGSPNHSGICDHQNAVTSSHWGMAILCGAVKHISPNLYGDEARKILLISTYRILWEHLFVFMEMNIKYLCKHIFTIIYHLPAILITMAPRYAPYSSTSCQPNFGPISSPPQGRAKLSAPGPQQMDARKIIK